MILNAESFAQQCVRVANFIDGLEYNISGSATLTKNVNGTLILSICSDFATSPGPDLHFLLSNSTTPNSPYYIISQIQSASGAQSFTIPATVDINQFQHVLIHCIQFNHFWGYGSLDAGTGTGNCSITLGVNENTLNSSKNFFPNPILNEINFTSSGNLSVFTIDGNLVFNTIQESEKFNLSEVESGLYFYSFNKKDGSTLNGKFLKQ